EQGEPGDPTPTLKLLLSLTHRREVADRIGLRLGNLFINQLQNFFQTQTTGSAELLTDRSAGSTPRAMHRMAQKRNLYRVLRGTGHQVQQFNAIEFIPSPPQGSRIHPHPQTAHKSTARARRADADTPLVGRDDELSDS